MKISKNKKSKMTLALLLVGAVGLMAVFTIPNLISDEKDRKEMAVNETQTAKVENKAEYEWKRSVPKVKVESSKKQMVVAVSSLNSEEPKASKAKKKVVAAPAATPKTKAPQQGKKAFPKTQKSVSKPKKSLAITQKTKSAPNTTALKTAAPKKMKKKEGCVYNTIFSIGTSTENFHHKTPDKVQEAVAKGVTWMADLQHADGGWSAGNFTHVGNTGKTPDHMEKSDPATTAMVSLALLRTGSILTKGPHAAKLRGSTEYLLTATEKLEPYQNPKPITFQGKKGRKQTAQVRVNNQFDFLTQVQSKLGKNIDVVLTSQFFSNIVDHLGKDPALKERVEKGLDKCVLVIQSGMEDNGSMKGGTWAGVLQSSLSTNALESAQAAGAAVEAKILHQAKAYQMGNFTAAGDVKTLAGAGIVLYSVSGSVRASAVRANQAQGSVQCAVESGVLDGNPDAVSARKLRKVGYTYEEAETLEQAHRVYNDGLKVALDPKTLAGFGNNGGEEYISFLQTGEAMLIGHDMDWKKWYNNTSGGLLKLQKNDGSWQGSHCISSPVFCTATCLLILGIDNDVDKLLSFSNKVQEHGTKP